MKKIIKLTESDLKRIIKRVLKEEDQENDKEDRVKSFLNDNTIKQETGVWSFTTCDEDEWDTVKKHIVGDGKQNRFSGPTAKQYFLSQNEDITEEEFDRHYDEWVDFIEQDRGFEDMNRQDFGYNDPWN